MYSIIHVCICILIQRARNDSFNLVEFFQALPKKHHTQLWTTVFTLTQDCVMTLDNEEQPTSENEGLDNSQVRGVHVIFQISRSEYRVHTKKSTVTLAVHVCRGLITVQLRTFSLEYV